METIDFNEVIRDPETISVVGGLIGVATKDKNGLAPRGYAPIYVGSDNATDRYIKIGSLDAYTGHTINVVMQVSGQRLTYGNYIIQAAGGNRTDTKASAEVKKIIEGTIDVGTLPRFYIRPLENGGGELYCSIRNYHYFHFSSPTGFKFELSKTSEDLPSDAEEITKK